MTLLFVFIAAFLITAPLVVLYTAGYRLNLENGHIVRTGLFSVTSIPKDANILVDGDERDSTPGFVKNLIPRDYRVLIQKDGYHDWTKTLPIYSHETTFVEDVTLFLDNEPTNLISADIASSTIGPDQSTLAYITTSASWIELWTHIIETSEQSLLYRISGTNTDAIDITWSADGDRILIEQDQGLSGSFTVIERSGLNPIELDDISERPITAAWWHPTDPLALLFTTTRGTFVYRLLSDTVNEIYPEPTLATLIEGQPVIIEQNDGSVSVFRYVDEQASLLAYLASGTYELLGAAEPLLLLHETQHDKLILIDTSQDDQPILLSVDGKGAEWAPDDSGRLLYWSDFEVHVYDPETYSDELLTRIGEPTQTATWHPEGNAILVSRANTIEAVELDWRDQRNIIELATGTNISTLWVTQNGRVAYFVGEVTPDRGLFKLELQRR